VGRDIGAQEFRKLISSQSPPWTNWKEFKLEKPRSRKSVGVKQRKGTDETAEGRDREKMDSRTRPTSVEQRIPDTEEKNND